MDENQNPQQLFKAITEKVKRKLDDGYSRLDTWRQLSGEIDSRFHKLLKREVTYCLSEKQMESITRLNQVLQFLFITMILSMVVNSFLFYQSTQINWLAIAWLAFYFIISYVISKAILLKRGFIYRSLLHIGLLITLFKASNFIFGTTDVIWNSIFMGLGVLLSIFSYLTFKKLFPTYKLFGDNSPKDNIDILD